MDNKDELRKLLLDAMDGDTMEVDAIDEDELLKDTDKERKVVKKGENKPKRACSNCTCGKKEEKVVVKKSGCGNCYKGDLFRCDGCPSLGLPPYKPGETVTFEMDDEF